MRDVQLKHLSYSNITLWFYCKRKWLLKYKYGVKIPSTPAQIFGTAMHRMIQKSWTNNQPIITYTNEFKRILFETIEEQGAKLANSAIYALAEAGESIINDPLVSNILNSVVVSGSAMIERQVEFTVPGVPISVVGYIDAIDVNGVPYDIKTSWNNWSRSRANAEVQPDFYLTALDQLGETQHAGKFTYVIVIKNTSAPAVYTIDSPRVGYTERTNLLVKTMWDEYNSGGIRLGLKNNKCSNCDMFKQCNEIL
jgi:CRISPR/Cas system-associated exonuclease Cas4 (RecB family)